jgi:hypothetical protein
MQPAFSKAVQEKVQLLHTDKLLAQIQDERAAEGLEAEKVKLDYEQTLADRRKNNQDTSPGKPKRTYDPKLGQPAGVWYKDLSPEERKENVYGIDGAAPRGLPTEEQE